MNKRRSSNVLWAFREAVRLVACSRCEVGKGDPCLDRKKEEATTYPCFTRVRAYRKKIGEQAFAERHSNPWPVQKGVTS